MSETNTAATTKDGEVQLDTDLYSRQLYVLDLSTMKFITKSRIFISGLKGLGVEIAKNIILAGPKTVVLHDPENAQWSDLSSQFYLTEEDIGKNRAAVSAKKLAELNPYVDVQVHTGAVDGEFLSHFQAAVFTNHTYEQLQHLNELCRAQKQQVPFIAARTFGLFGYLFVDFGKEFTIVDVDGEQAPSLIISNITKDGLVTVHEEQRIDFESGDKVRFTEVQGMDELNNAGPVEVEVVSPFTFKIRGLHLESFKPYAGGGLVQKVKLPKTVKFLSFSESIQHPQFLLSDFAKFDQPDHLHFGFHALSQFESKHKRLPEPGNDTEAEEVIALAKGLNEQAKKTNGSLKDGEQRVHEVDEVKADVVKLLARHSRGDLNPMAAFFGGIVAQEALKVSGKFHPTMQWFHFGAEEALPAESLPAAELQAQGNRYDGQTAVFGKSFQEKLSNFKLFLVGSGALGCEFLKNFALMGVGVGAGGMIHLTDMDTIEKSNLNRQFLFRNHDIGKNKSEAASGAVKKMNPKMNIKCYTTPVGPDTENLFDDDFWDNLDVVCNALDNVKARTYTDGKCVYHYKPLLESGTLGTKANTQVVLPGVTESYSSSKDPPEKSIPLCTLKNFPNQIEHTIEWAKNSFVGFFQNSAEEVNSYLTQDNYLEKLKTNPLNAQKESLVTLYSMLTLSKDLTFEKCVEWARHRFQESFHNSIAQLLYIFPKNHTVDGAPFWSGPKRAPTPLVFDPNDPLHLEFITSAANLLAFIFKLPQNRDVEYIRKVVSQVQVAEFSPSKGVRIKANENDNTTEGSDDDDKIVEDILSKLPTRDVYKGFSMEPAMFEKDDDKNFHIAFITSSSNLRARNYSIQEASFFETKKIAGRIIPAIATTTAMITGLVSLELYKLLHKEHPIEKFRNAFVNLSLPLLTFSEPMPCKKNKTDKAKGKIFYPEGHTLWDFIHVDIGDVTLKEFCDWFEKTHGWKVSSMTYDKYLLYSSFFPGHDKRLPRKLTELIVDISKKDFFATQKVVCFLVEPDVEEGDDGIEPNVEIVPIKYRFRK